MEDIPEENNGVLDLSVVKENIPEEISVVLDLSIIPEDNDVILDLSTGGNFFCTPAHVDILNETTAAVGAVMELDDSAEETDDALYMSVGISSGGEEYSAINGGGGSIAHDGDDSIANANEVLPANVEDSFTINNTAEYAHSRSDGSLLIMSAGGNRGIVDETRLEDEEEINENCNE